MAETKRGNDNERERGERVKSELMQERGEYNEWRFKHPCGCVCVGEREREERGEKKVYAQSQRKRVKERRGIRGIETRK